MVMWRGGDEGAEEGEERRGAAARGDGRAREPIGLGD